MDFKSNYEIVIIGSGAGAAALLETLVENSFDPSEILVLERGNKLPSSNSAASRFINTYENAGVVPCFGSPTIPFGIANCIGGGPEINGSLIWKTPEHIKNDWFENHELPFSKNIFEEKLASFEMKLEVKNSHIDENHDYGSYLLNKAAKELDFLCVPARRALKYSCCSNNLCAFGSTNDSKNTTFKMIMKNLIKKGLNIKSNVSRINFKFSNQSGPYSLNFKLNSIDKTVIAKKIFLCAGAINTPLLVSKIRKKRYSKYNLKFHLNLKSIGLIKNEIPDVPGTMFSAQIQEFSKDNQYIMPFNWHKAHVLSILDRHYCELDFDYIYRHGIGITSQVSNEDVNATIQVLSHGGNAYKFISHSIIEKESILNSIKTILERTYLVFNQLGIDKVLCPSAKSPVFNLSESIFKTMKNPSNLDMLSVHHMSSLPIGGEDVEVNGSLKDFSNIFIADSSLLPTIVGESPQLTIMAFVSALYDKKFN